MRYFQLLALCGLTVLSIISSTALGATDPQAQVPLPGEYEYFDPRVRDPLVDEYASNAVHWDYIAGSGPLMWTRNNGNHWPYCANEVNQSPINIDPQMPPSGSKYKWSGRANACFNMTNNGHTIELLPNWLTPLNEDFKAEGARMMGIMINDDRFYLQNIHFHTPSEHLYLKEHFPLEAHFVMKNAKTGSLAVRGIFFDITSGRESDFFDGISPNLGSVAQEGDWVRVTVNTANIMRIFQDMEAQKKVYHYTGSLTTPPCTGNVAWHVLSVPQLVSVETYNRLKRIMKFNSRYPQAKPGKGNLIQRACANTSGFCEDSAWGTCKN